MITFRADIDGLDGALNGILKKFRDEIGESRTRRKLLEPALRVVGGAVTRRIRATTPVSRAALRGRQHLARTVRGRIRREPDGNLSYYGGYLRGRVTGVRFQQVLAVTYGVRGRPGRDIIRRALRHEAGIDGQRFRRLLVEAVLARVDRLILEAGRGGRTNLSAASGARLRSALRR